MKKEYKTSIIILLASIIIALGITWMILPANNGPLETDLETGTIFVNENAQAMGKLRTMEEIIEKSHMDVLSKADPVKMYMDASAGQIVPEKLLSKMDVLAFFRASEISNAVFQRIYGKSYKEDCAISRTDLRYIRVLYRGFDGAAHTGEMIVNAAIADAVLDIFYELYQAGYPIEKMLLIDNYDANDELSMTDNNTSCFNYRVISGSNVWSNHSKGLAVDINPLYNPYVKTVNGELQCEPAAANAYIDRSQDFNYKIDEQDICYKIFTKYGFSWGGSWEGVKDYQHFEFQF